MSRISSFLRTEDSSVSQRIAGLPPRHPLRHRNRPRFYFYHQELAVGEVSFSGTVKPLKNLKINAKMIKTKNKNAHN